MPKLWGCFSGKRPETGASSRTASCPGSQWYLSACYSYLTRSNTLEEKYRLCRWHAGSHLAPQMKTKGSCLIYRWENEGSHRFYIVGPGLKSWPWLQRFCPGRMLFSRSEFLCSVAANLDCLVLSRRTPSRSVYSVFGSTPCTRPFSGCRWW